MILGKRAVKLVKVRNVIPLILRQSANKTCFMNTCDVVGPPSFDTKMRYSAGMQKHVIALVGKAANGCDMLNLI
jgi:hypothetical protein